MIGPKAKNYIRKFPLILSFLRRVRAIFCRRYRKNMQVNRWVIKNIKFINKLHLTTFIFTEKQAFIETNDGLRYEYLPSLDGGVLGLEFKKKWEEFELDLIIKNLEKGQTFFDIGANFGWFSVNVASKMDNVNVYAFEPSPKAFNMFLTNIERNKLKGKITTDNCAVTDFCGEVNITSDFHTGNYISVRELNKDIQSQKVACTTLDQYIKDKHILQVDFIKCDIEGAELFMLKGAENSIRRFRPYILLEIAEAWTSRLNYAPVEIVDFLEHLDYRFYGVNGAKLIAPSENIKQDLSQSNNFLFYHQNKPPRI